MTWGGAGGSARSRLGAGAAFGGAGAAAAGPGSAETSAVAGWDGGGSAIQPSTQVAAAAMLATSRSTRALPTASAIE